MRFGSLFNGKSFQSFQSSLAGARGGQVVAVLVLGPKPQPLLVLLLWFFGSVLSRATWEETRNRRPNVSHLVGRRTFVRVPRSGRRRDAGGVLIEKPNLPQLGGPIPEKGEQRVTTYYRCFILEELHRQALPFLNLTDLASLERGCWQGNHATISICGFFSTDFLQQSKGCTLRLQSRTLQRNVFYCTCAC